MNRRDALKAVLGTGIVPVGAVASVIEANQRMVAVIECPHRLSVEQRQNIEQQSQTALKGAFGDIPVIVLDGGLKLRIEPESEANVVRAERFASTRDDDEPRFYLTEQLLADCPLKFWSGIP